MIDKNTRVTLGLTNPKSPTNVGAVMRAVGCFNSHDANGVFYTGDRYTRAVKYQTDTKNSADKFPLTAVSCLLECIPENAKVVCVDLIEGATPLPDFIHPENAYYIFGPEDGTISQAVIDRADAVVFIPTTGCLNLAASVNVLLYDRLSKSQSAQDNDALIRQSRDVNNRVKVNKI